MTELEVELAAVRYLVQNPKWGKKDNEPLKSSNDEETSLKLPK